MKNPYVILLISIVSVSFAAIFIVTAESPPLTIAFYRLLFTIIFIIPFVILKKTYRLELIHLNWLDVLMMICIGIILSVHFSLWISSLTKTSVASSVILVTSHPILVAPISHYFLKEKLSYLNLLGVVISIFGVGILVVGNYGLYSSTLEGNVLAFFGGVAAGLYILGGRKMRKDISTPCYAFIVYMVACIILFILCILFNSPLTGISYRDYSIFFLMAIISGLLGHTLYNLSLKYIRASIASVSLLGEPLGSSLLALIIPWIDQIPTIYTSFGGFFILIGIYFTSKK